MRRPKIRALILVIILLAGYGTAGAQPANDDCTSATVIGALPFTDNVDTSTATTETGDPAQSCTFGGPHQNVRSVWYSYTASATEDIGITTGGSDYDTGLTVYTGACGALNEAGCDDDGGPELTSQLVLSVTAGTTYLIEVTGNSLYAPDGGNLTFRLDRVASEEIDLGTCAQANGVYAGVLDATDATFGRPGATNASRLYPPFGTDGYDCSPLQHQYDSYTLQVLAPGSLALRAETVSGGDTRLAIYYSATDPTPFPGANLTGAAACVNAVASDDSSGTALLSRIVLPNAPAGWYTVVATMDLNPGPYELEIDCAGPPPAPAPALSLPTLGFSLLLLAGVSAFGIRRLARQTQVRHPPRR